MNTTKIQWKKLPSVTRANKHFYRGRHSDGTFYTVAQSFLTDLWNVTDDFRHASYPEFKTAKEAMRAVENIGTVNATV